MIKICSRLWIISAFSILIASEASRPEAIHSVFNATSVEKQLTFSWSIRTLFAGLTWLEQKQMFCSMQNAFSE